MMVCRGCQKPNDRDPKNTYCTLCNRERVRAWREANPGRAQENSRRWREAIKLLAFDAYGGRICACCGETELVFLSLDHINDDGAEHRRSLKHTGGSQMYWWLRNNGYPDGFQVLCHNCNWAKHAVGTCPHAD